MAARFASVVYDYDIQIQNFGRARDREHEAWRRCTFDLDSEIAYS